eukprot:scpid21327/ scgid5790/ Probable E3 ubiquitin-protein ligase DTX3; Protein deltex-3; RING finger protein 154 &gt; Probable E3 ubiquitin-protein ligase DTX3; Protein deltex-3
MDFSITFFSTKNPIVHCSNSADATRRKKKDREINRSLSWTMAWGLGSIKDVEEIARMDLSVTVDVFENGSGDFKLFDYTLDVVPEVSGGCEMALSPGVHYATSLTTQALATACKQSCTTLSDDRKRIIAQAPHQLVLFQSSVLTLLGCKKPNMEAHPATHESDAGSEQAHGQKGHVRNGHLQPARMNSATGDVNIGPRDINDQMPPDESGSQTNKSTEPNPRFSAQGSALENGRGVAPEDHQRQGQCHEPPHRPSTFSRQTISTLTGQYENQHTSTDTRQSSMLLAKHATANASVPSGGQLVGGNSTQVHGSPQQYPTTPSQYPDTATSWRQPTDGRASNQIPLECSPQPPKPTSAVTSSRHLEETRDFTEASFTKMEGEETKFSRQFEVSAATAAFIQSDNGEELMESLRDDYLVDITLASNKNVVFIDGPSIQLLEGAFAEIRAAEPAQEDTTGQSKKYSTSAMQHPVRSQPGRKTNPAKSANQLAKTKGSGRQFSSGGGFSRNCTAGSTSRLNSATGKTRDSAVLEQMASRTHKEILRGHKTFLQYLNEEYNLEEIAKESGCQISFSSDGSQLIITSQSKADLQNCFDRVDSLIDHVKQTDKTVWRISADIPNDKLDALRDCVSGEYPDIKCYLEKRCFVVLNKMEEKCERMRKHYESVVRSQHWKQRKPADYTEGPRPVHHTLQDLASPKSSKCLTKSPHTMWSDGSSGSSFKTRHSQAGSVEPSWKTIGASSRTYQNGVQISICVGDITQQDVSVIVSASNGKLVPHGGVARAIAQAGGARIQQEARAQLSEIGLHEFPTGSAVTTTAGKLNAKHVIHAIGPDCRAETDAEENNALLKQVVMRALSEAASTLKVSSVAFPAISSGTYGMPLARCALVMLTTINEFCSRHNSTSLPALTDIRIVLLERNHAHAFQAALAPLKPLPMAPGASTSNQRGAEEATSYNNGVEETWSAAGTHDMLGAGDEAEECPCCSQELVSLHRLQILPCKHQVCNDCIARFKQDNNEKCPFCRKQYGQVIGPQPEGCEMKVTQRRSFVAGHEGYGTLHIQYRIPSGVQTSRHQNEGVPYNADTRHAYLPDNPQGNRVLKLLKKAFDARQTFTIGHSIMRGVDNVVVWNDIHHKTSLNGGEFGYPDPGYLSRVTRELESRGIK